MIKWKFFAEEYLFQMMRIDSEVKAKIIVQARTINEPEGVHSGRFRVLYQVLPVSAKYDAAEAVIITKRGMKM